MPIGNERSRESWDDASQLRKKQGPASREANRAGFQRELADRVKIDYYTFISQIEAGRGRVPAEGSVIGL